MAKERSTSYRFRYEDPWWQRTKQPLLERGVQVVMEIRYGRNVRCIQVIHRCTVGGVEKIESLVGKLPQRLRGESQDVPRIVIEQMFGKNGK